MCSLNREQQFNLRNRSSELVPAEIWGENVDALVLGEQRVEGAPVGSVDAVALVGLPEGQLAASSTHDYFTSLSEMHGIKFVLLVSLLCCQHRYLLHLKGGKFKHL